MFRCGMGISRSSKKALLRIWGRCGDLWKGQRPPLSNGAAGSVPQPSPEDKPPLKVGGKNRRPAR